MRVGLGIAVVALVSLAPRGTPAEPTSQELLAAFESKLKRVSESAGPSIACVVVSRNEAYPKAEASLERLGQLGGFDPKEFLKGDASPARADLARKLDLSDPRAALDHGCGGGVVIDTTGLILTNYHTIEDATKIYVHLVGGKGSYADIHAADKRSDLAVLKLITPPAGLTKIQFAEVRTVDRADGRKKTVFTGKLVALMVHSAVGGFAMDRPSLAHGTLTNLRSRHPAAAAKIDDQRPHTVYDFGTFLEYDVRLTFGGSGGALLNLDGELVGLTTAIAAATGPETGPGYAMSMDANTRRIVEVLRRGEEVEYGFLGVVPEDTGNGVRINEITPQGPAHLAGLRYGDEIGRVDDIPVLDRRDLFFTVGQALAGTTVKVWVNNRSREIEVTLGKIPHALPYVASVRPEPVFGLRVEYSSVLVNQDLQRRFRSVGVPPGVAVRELVPESPAAAKFKALGELSGRVVITHVNGTAVTNPSEFYKAAKGQQSVKLTLLDPLDTGGRTRELTLP
jgi:serine protease Do